MSLKCPHKGHKILLFLIIQFKFKNQVEKLHRVLQREQPVNMKIRRGVLDTAQRDRR
jgi:hypothetical protein